MSAGVFFADGETEVNIDGEASFARNEAAANGGEGSDRTQTI